MSILFPVILIAVAMILEYITVKHAFDGIEYSLDIKKQAVECDERFELVTAVVNKKRYPVLHMKITERVPFEMQVEEGAAGARVVTSALISRNPKKHIEQTVYLMPRQRLTRTLYATLPARGRYTVQSADISVGDLIGVTERQKGISMFREVVVYPRRADIPELNDALGGYMGDVSVRRFILSDPILTCGFREYTGREPMKDIAWTQSLREGTLMVRRYDYTSEPSAAVILNTSADRPDAQLTEWCYSLARSVAERLESMNIRYSFYTNTDTASAAGRWSYIDEGIGERHLTSILEGLGRATGSTRFGVEKLIDSASVRSEKQSAVIFVTPAMDAASRAALRRFEGRTGQRAFIVEAQRGAGE